MITERLYGALLLAFPRSFRIRYGGPMRQIFRERYRAASLAGREVRARFLMRTFVDVLSNALLERVSAIRRWWLFPNFNEPLAWSEQENRTMYWQAFLMDLRFAGRHQHRGFGAFLELTDPQRQPGPLV